MCGFIASSPLLRLVVLRVMAGLVPATHVFLGRSKQGVGARHKAGHDSEIDLARSASLRVMAGLVPAAHVFGAASKAWVPGTRPGMTQRLTWHVLPLSESC